MAQTKMQQFPEATVLVVSNDVLTRVLSHRLIALQIRDSIVHEAHSGTVALEMLRRLRPRVLVTEASLPDMQAISLIVKAAHLVPGIRTIIIGSDPGSRRDPLPRGGLVSYLPKDEMRGWLGALVADALDPNASSSSDE